MNRHLISCFYMTTNTVSKFHQNRSRSVKWFLYNSLHIYRELLLIYKFLFYPLTLNIIRLIENNNIFLRLCLCIFESDTVKSVLSRFLGN